MHGNTDKSVAVLTGGVGGARYLTGQISVTPPTKITAVVNIADDVTLHGLHISPDIDTIIYTLAGMADTERGWGLAGDTWHTIDELRTLGVDAWFNLGDRDIGTHLFRTSLLRQGLSLSEVTVRLAKARGLNCNVLPVSNDPVQTKIILASGKEIDFQEYFVRLSHDVAIAGVRFAGVKQARPAPGVLAAINNADLVVIAPSNPVVSIDPILSIPDIFDTLSKRREYTIAISPIISGKALKGPADRMMRELGEDASVTGVASRYRRIAKTLVIDTKDSCLSSAVEKAGMEVIVAPTIMHSTKAAADLVRRVMTASETKNSRTV